MKKFREAILEVFIVFVVGGLIGSILAVVSNLFVAGVLWMTAQRASSDFLDVTVAGQVLSFSSLVFLWAAAAAVIIIKKLFSLVNA